MNVKNSVFTMLERSFIWCYTICNLYFENFHDRIASYSLFLTKTLANVVRKIQNFPNMSKFTIYYSQNLLFWSFEFQDNLIYYHIKWLEIVWGIALFMFVSSQNKNTLRCHSFKNSMGKSSSVFNTKQNIKKV